MDKLLFSSSQWLGCGNVSPVLPDSPNPQENFQVKFPGSKIWVGDPSDHLGKPFGEDAPELAEE